MRIPAFSCSILRKSTLDISSSSSNTSFIKRRCSNCNFPPKDRSLIRSAIVPVSLYFFSNNHRLVLLIVTPSSARRRWITFNRIPSHKNLMTLLCISNVILPILFNEDSLISVLYTKPGALQNNSSNNWNLQLNVTCDVSHYQYNIAVSIRPEAGS